MRDTSINLEIVTGGFILVYDDLDKDVVVREVFTSPRKVSQKIKELIDRLALVNAAGE